MFRARFVQHKACEVKLRVRELEPGKTGAEFKQRDC